MRKPLQFFLSYSRRDEEFARKFAADLRTEGMEPWLDVTNLTPGERWENEIRNAITDAEFLLILLSTESVKSEWLKREAVLAISRGEGRVIPIIIDEGAKSAVPSFLSQIQWLDMSTSALYALGLQKLSQLALLKKSTVKSTDQKQDIRLENRDADQSIHIGRDVKVNYKAKPSDTIDVDDFVSKVVEKLRHQIPHVGSDITRISQNETFSNPPSNLVFVVISFEEDMDPIFDGIKAAAEAAGLVAKRVKDVVGDYKIDSKLIEMIHQASMVVVDLTHERPNVYFELGYARGIGKTVITTARRGTSLHFDVQSWTCDFYTDSRVLERRLIERFKLEWDRLTASPATRQGKNPSAR